METPDVNIQARNMNLPQPDAVADISDLPAIFGFETRSRSST
jgi:hypothetical protein